MQTLIYLHLDKGFYMKSNFFGNESTISSVLTFDMNFLINLGRTKAELARKALRKLYYHRLINYFSYTNQLYRIDTNNIKTEENFLYPRRRLLPSTINTLL